MENIITNKKRKVAIFRNILIIVITGVIFLSFYMGLVINHIYYLGILLSLFMMYGIIRLNHLMKIILIEEELANGWGQAKKEDRNFELIRCLIKYKDNLDDKAYMIDDFTWNDFNMDEIFCAVDRTLTTPGQQMLYLMLRTPLMDREILNKRNILINLLQADNKIRKHIFKTLKMLGTQNNEALPLLFWGELKFDIKFKWLYFIMPVLSIASIISITFLGFNAVLYCIAPAFIVNMLLYSNMKKKYMGYLSCIRYLGPLIRAAKQLANINNPVLQEYCNRLKSAAKICSVIERKSRTLGIEKYDPFGLVEYINIFLLYEVRSFIKISDYIKKFNEELRVIYKLLGELDALLSIASYRTGALYYIEPQFTGHNMILDIKDAAHPLLNNPVANTIVLNRQGSIITGSNMSGKSTFLRTIGINVLLAQTICTCTARAYTGSFFKIMTSISKTDNLLDGKSYYLVEAEQLYSIVSSINDNVSVLCIIDEIFRGTNSLERINIAVEYLDYLIRHDVMVLAATHDLELAKTLDNRYERYYFSETVGHNGLEFDYKLKYGISSSTNAVKVLGFLGYPGDIILGAEERIKKSLAK